MTIYVGRLPIFDRTTAVAGYRIIATESVDGTPENRRAVPSFAIAAAHGLGRLVGRLPAFLRADVDDLPALDSLDVQPGRVVVELTATGTPPEALRAAVETVTAQGLDVLVDGPDAETVRRDLGAAAFVRIDARGRSDDAVAEVLAACRAARCQTIGGAVEDVKAFDRYVRLGFDLLEGGYLHHPPADTRRPAPDVSACARLVVRLGDPDVEPAEVAELLQADAMLSYRVLRASNTAWIGRQTPVRSVREAILLLGLRTIRAWVITIVLAAEAGRSPERVQRVLTRARACEVVADSTRLADPGAAFTVGLLSGLHVALGTPLPRLVADVTPDAELADALLHGRGPLGAIVTAVDAYESGHEPPEGLPGIDAVTLQRSYLAALSWSLQTYSMVDGAG